MRPSCARGVYCCGHPADLRRSEPSSQSIARFTLSRRACLTAEVTTRTVFDHIPRTAGTSIKHALGQALGDRGDLPDVSGPHHWALTTAAHLWYFPGESLAAEWVYATVLRDPVDRFLSQYWFFRAHCERVRSGRLQDPDVVAAVQLSLDEYVADPARQRAYTNVQARHFARRVCADPDDLTDRELRDAAIASLEEYDIVGLVPALQPFMDTYCDVLGVPRERVPHVNRAPARPASPVLQVVTWQQLHASNMVDVALCQWVRDRAPARGRRARPPSAVTPSPIEFGSRTIRLVSSRCAGRDSGVAVVDQGEPVVVQLCGYAAVPEPQLTAGIAVRDARGGLVYATNTRLRGDSLSVTPPGTFTVSFTIDRSLAAGVYDVTLALHRGFSHKEGCYHWRDRATSFLVLPRHRRRSATSAVPDGRSIDMWPRVLR